MCYEGALGKSGSRKMLQDQVIAQNQRTLPSSEQFKKIVCDENKITLREMTEEDLDDVMLIENESFFEPYQRSFFKKSLYKNNVFLLVAEREIEPDEKELQELCQTRKMLRQYQYYDSDDMDIDDMCQQQQVLNAPVTHVIAGYVSYWIKHGEVTVVSIAVAAHSRGRGVGSKFMQYVVEWAKLSEVPRIYLHVSIFNKGAQQLYQKFGFKPAKYLDNYYRDENEDAILMCLDLDPVL
jgi:ribosomal-protein-alanine N-acetyltransferase